MYSKDGVEYRLAEVRDAFSMMKLYQLSVPAERRDAAMLDFRQVEKEIADTQSIWILGEKNGEVVTVLTLLLDRENRLAKIARNIIDPSWEDSTQILKSSLPMLIDYLRAEKRSMEVVYATTRAFDLKQQQLTLDLGFRVLGIFPGSSGKDRSRVGGLSAYFFDRVLDEKRHSDFMLHPVVDPFFQIVQKECDLPTLALGTPPTIDPQGFETLPELEMIQAPAFVAQRFHQLNQKRSLAVHFYPFTVPNVIITDPEQRVEIFARVIPEYRFATIIGERLDREINPTELYLKVSNMLAATNVSYIEVINDAADQWGIECILGAGYLPCGYFPCLKRHGEKRRDYVVLARAFERLFSSPVDSSEIHPRYLEFVREYYRLEGRQYLERLLPFKTLDDDFR